MSIKENNEITIKIACSSDKLINNLKNKGFKEGRKFSLDDYYLIPNSLNINEMTTRDILSKAIIIRYISDNEKIIQMITFKKKNIDEKGEILNQKAINCEIFDYKSAINLFNELGYYVIINVKEDDVIYYKDNLELAFKFIKDSDTLIEIETNENHKTIAELKELVKKLEIPIEKEDYFVKKVENELNKLLKRK